MKKGGFFLTIYLFAFYAVSQQDSIFPNLKGEGLEYEILSSDPIALQGAFGLPTFLGANNQFIYLLIGGAKLKKKKLVSLEKESLNEYSEMPILELDPKISKMKFFDIKVFGDNLFVFFSAKQSSNVKLIYGLKLNKDLTPLGELKKMAEIKEKEVYSFQFNKLNKDIALLKQNEIPIFKKGFYLNYIIYDTSLEIRNSGEFDLEMTKRTPPNFNPNFTKDFYFTKEGNLQGYVEYYTQRVLLAERKSTLVSIDTKNNKVDYLSPYSVPDFPKKELNRSVGFQKGEKIIHLGFYQDFEEGQNAKLLKSYGLDGLYKLELDGDTRELIKSEFVPFDTNFVKSINSDNSFKIKYEKLTSNNEIPSKIKINNVYFNPYENSVSLYCYFHKTQVAEIKVTELTAPNKAIVVEKKVTELTAPSKPIVVEKKEIIYDIVYGDIFYIKYGLEENEIIDYGIVKRYEKHRESKFRYWNPMQVIEADKGNYVIFNTNVGKNNVTKDNPVFGERISDSNHALFISDFSQKTNTNNHHFLDVEMASPSIVSKHYNYFYDKGTSTFYTYWINAERKVIVKKLNVLD